MAGKKRNWLDIVLFVGFLAWALISLCIGDYSSFLWAFLLLLTLVISKAAFAFCRKRDEKITRSTVYTGTSVAIGLISFLLFEFEALTNIYCFPTIPLYLLAGAIGLLAFANIVATGEIIKFSGVGKIIILLIVGLAVAQLTALQLNRARLEQHYLKQQKNISVQTQKEVDGSQQADEATAR